MAHSDKRPDAQPRMFNIGPNATANNADARRYYDLQSKFEYVTWTLSEIFLNAITLPSIVISNSSVKEAPMEGTYTHEDV